MSTLDALLAESHPHCPSAERLHAILGVIIAQPSITFELHDEVSVSAFRNLMRCLADGDDAVHLPATRIVAHMVRQNKDLCRAVVLVRGTEVLMARATVTNLVEVAQDCLTALLTIAVDSNDESKRDIRTSVRWLPMMQRIQSVCHTCAHTSEIPTLFHTLSSIMGV